MAAKSVTDLAQALPESERKDLLDRIQRSLALNARQDQAIVKAVSSQDQRAMAIQEALNHLTFVQRIMLWVRKLFTAKTEADLYVDMKMTEIARILNHAGVADALGRHVEPTFAREVYKLYTAAVPMKKFLEVIWSNEAALASAMQYMIEGKVPKARSTLYDFIPVDEIQLLFEAAENKGPIRQELVNRLNNYIDSIPETVFTELEQAVMPLYYLRQLCFFDYLGLFRAFYADQHSLERGNPEFKAVNVDKVLEQLEALQYAIHTARKASSLDVMPATLYRYVQLKRHEREQAQRVMVSEEHPFGDLPPPGMAAPESATDERDATDKDAGEKPAKDQSVDEGLRQLRKDMVYLQETLGQVADKCHLADIIRYFREDPYYRFMAYVPSINLREFYIATLRMQLLLNLDKEYAGIRRMIVGNLVKAMFPHGVQEFQHFRGHPYGVARPGLPGFRYVESLQFLYNFLHQVFFGKLREVCRTMAKSLPNRNRDTGSELTFHTSGLETQYEMLKALDMAFSPDTEGGKNYIRLKNAVQKDASQERPYRAFVASRDKQNRDLLEEAIEHIRALAEAVDEIAAIPAPLLTERFAVLVTQGQTKTVGDFVRAIAARLRQADRLLRYQRALDDELPVHEV